jgi:hypothetical protein
VLCCLRCLNSCTPKTSSLCAVPLVHEMMVVVTSCLASAEPCRSFQTRTHCWVVFFCVVRRRGTRSLWAGLPCQLPLCGCFSFDQGPEGLTGIKGAKCGLDTAVRGNVRPRTVSGVASSDYLTGPTDDGYGNGPCRITVIES